MIRATGIPVAWLGRAKMDAFINFFSTIAADLGGPVLACRPAILTLRDRAALFVDMLKLALWSKSRQPQQTLSCDTGVAQDYKFCRC